MSCHWNTRRFLLLGIMVAFIPHHSKGSTCSWEVFEDTFPPDPRETLNGIMSLNACQERCDERPACVAVTHAASVCHIYNSIPALETVNGWTHAQKFCTNETSTALTTGNMENTASVTTPNTSTPSTTSTTSTKSTISTISTPPTTPTTPNTSTTSTTSTKSTISTRSTTPTTTTVSSTETTAGLNSTTHTTQSTEAPDQPTNVPTTSTVPSTPETSPATPSQPPTSPTTTANKTQAEPEGTSAAVIAGSVAAVVAVIVGVNVVVVVIVLRRKRRKGSASPADNTDEDLRSTAGNSTLAFATTLSDTNETALQLSHDEHSLVEDSHVYQNYEKVYSNFRNAASHLDNVQKCLVDRLASEELRTDFKNIPVMIYDEDTKAGKVEINTKKNRFSSIIPYDCNRVVLKDGYEKGSANDYINASYIKGFARDNEYIAAQGPKDTTATDFWRMIWQEGITHIVMLTNLREGEKKKCYQYWPEEGSVPLMFGHVTVTSNRTECRSDVLIRTFTVTKSESDESREVTQYHYVSWPDFGVPMTASLVKFWRYVTKRTHEQEHTVSPVLVHCSAGVGRTGTFIGLDLAMQRAVKDEEVDIVGLVTSLREQRCLMVQAADQFVFLHTAVLEAYTSRDYILPMDEFVTVFSAGVDNLYSHPRIDQEFKMLMEMQSLAPTPKHNLSKEKDNIKKNRNPEILPADEHIVNLTEKVSGRNQYINAVYMPTFRAARGSIATQLPLPSTLVDFWGMVYGNDVTTVVSLSSPNEEQEVTKFCKYWPRAEKEKVIKGPYTITCQSVSHKSEHFKVYSLTVQKKKMKATRQVQVLHYNGWTGETGGKATDILEVIDTLVTSHTSATSQPYVVQCTDGVGKSGLFTALSDVIDRLTYDREIDVYMTVRHVQSVTPNAVTSAVQYRYLYETVHQRCQEMQVYANE